MDVLSLMKSWWSCPAKGENMAEEMTEKFCPDAQGISDYWSLVVVFTHTSLFVTTKLPVYMIVLKAAMSLTLTII